MSPKKLLRNWTPCKLCKLHKHTHKQVISKGPVPAKVFIVGEAPGRSETAIGEPFVGPSGKLLDYLLTDAFSRDNTSLTLEDCLITNVVACVPWEDEESRKGFRPPTMGEATACQPRLNALFQLAKPDLVLLVGKSAEKFATKLLPLSSSREVPTPPPYLPIYHPAYLLRKGNTPTSPRKSLEYTQTVIKIRDFLREVYR